MIKLPSGAYFKVEDVVWANWRKDRTAFIANVSGDTEDRYFFPEDGVFLERALEEFINPSLQRAGEGN